MVLNLLCIYFTFPIFITVLYCIPLIYISLIADWCIKASFIHVADCFICIIFYRIKPTAFADEPTNWATVERTEWRNEQFQTRDKCQCRYGCISALFIDSTDITLPFLLNGGLWVPKWSLLMPQNAILWISDLANSILEDHAEHKPQQIYSNEIHLIASKLLFSLSV